MSVAVPTISGRVRGGRLLMPLLALGAAAGGAVSVAELSAGYPWAPVVFAWLLLAVLVVRLPTAAIALTLGCGIFVDEGSLNFPDSWTDTIPLYTSLASGAGISGAYVTPMEIMVLLLLMLVVAGKVANRELRWPSSPMAPSVALLTSVLVGTELYGLAFRRANLQVSVQELRSWFFLIGCFVLVSLVVRSKRHAQSVLWAIVIAVGFKGIQGTVRYLFVLLPAGKYPLPNLASILGHEEAFTFGMFLALVAALWLFGVSGRLRSIATALAPFVVIADLANQRRTAWFIVAASLVILVAVGIVCLPDRRRALATGACVVAVLTAIYLPTQWDKSGLFAQPARAIASIFKPDSRDASSNGYRVLENANLQMDIRHQGLLPSGFGVVVDKPIPMWDASKIDAFIDYVPHNQILYIWYRLGSLGVCAFWWLVGMAIITALQLARGRDRMLTVIGAFAACAVAGWVVQGMFDQGLTSHRTAILLGSLLGIVEWLWVAARAGDQPKSPARNLVAA